MLLLRRITSEGFELNQCLGDSYGVIYKQKDVEMFKKTLDIFHLEDEDDIEKIFGFISYKSGEKLEPLYKKSRYYIMTENGATFANITYKNK